MIAGEGVAITLAQIGVDVAQINRKHLPGPAEADVPGGVALVGNATGERSGAVERVAGAEIPVCDFAGRVPLHAIRDRRERVRGVAAEVDTAGPGPEPVWRRA